MLIENDLMGRNISQSIAGIGINMNQEVFHSYCSQSRYRSGKSQENNMIFSKYLKEYHAPHSI